VPEERFRVRRSFTGVPSSRVSRMVEPTYEDLKARIAELEKRVGNLQYRVSYKGGVSV
jgi:hypothetical protein